MRFIRRPRCEYTVTDRKRAAAIRLQRRQRDALPLLGALIAEAQPSIDDLMDTRVAAWVTSQQNERDRRAAQWRRGRRLLDAHPPPVRAALLAYWNGHRWLPGDPGYLLDMLHGFKVGQLILVNGAVQHARVTIPVAEAAAAFGAPKPRAQGWFTAGGPAPRNSAPAIRTPTRR